MEYLCILMGQLQAACGPLEYSLWLLNAHGHERKLRTLEKHAFAWVSQATVSSADQALRDSVT